MHGGVIHRVRRGARDLVIGHRVAAVDAYEVRVERLGRRKIIEAPFANSESSAQEPSRAARVHDQSRPQLHRLPRSAAPPPFANSMECNSVWSRKSAPDAMASRNRK